MAFFKLIVFNKYLLNIYYVLVAIGGKRDGPLNKREIHLDLVLTLYSNVEKRKSREKEKKYIYYKVNSEKYIKY